MTIADSESENYDQRKIVTIKLLNDKIHRLITFTVHIRTDRSEQTAYIQIRRHDSNQSLHYLPITQQI